MNIKFIHYKLLQGLFVLYCCIFPFDAKAQNIVELLLGGKKGPDLQLQTPRDKRLSQIKQRLSELDKQLNNQRKRKKEQSEHFKREQQNHRTQAQESRLIPIDAWWRGEADVVQLRLQIAQSAEQSVEEVGRLESALALFEQNLQTLRQLLQNYLQVNTEIGEQIERYYRGAEDALKLYEDWNKLRLQIDSSQKILEQSAALQRKLLAQQDNNQIEFDRVRRQMVADKIVISSDVKGESRLIPLPSEKLPASDLTPLLKPKSMPVPQSKPAMSLPIKQDAATTTSRPIQDKELAATTQPTESQPVAPSAEALEHKQRHEQYLQRLHGALLRQQFEFHRLHRRWLAVRLRDEALEQEIAQFRIQLYQQIADQMGTRLKNFAAHSRDGIWYWQPPQLKRELLQQLSQHTNITIKQASDSISEIHKKLAIRWQQRDITEQVLQFLVLILMLFVAVFIALFLRKRWGLLIDSLDTRAKTLATTRVLWRGLEMFYRVLYDLTPYLLCLFFLLFLFWMWEYPVSWLRFVWRCGWMLWIWRICWTLADQFFPAQTDRSFFPNLESAGIHRFRRVIKAASSFAFFFLPLLFAIQLLDYPEALVHLFYIVFYAFLLTSVIILFINPAFVLALVPTDTMAGRMLILLIYRCYPFIFLIAFGIYGIYVWGYINFAAYLAKGIVLTALLMGAAFGLNQFSWAFSRWAFGFAKGEKGWFDVEKRWARHILRFIRIVIGVILVLGSISLILEVWGIAAGLSTVVRLFNYPFVQIKDTQINLLSLIKLLSSIGGSFWLAHITKHYSKKYVYPVLRMSNANQHASNTVLGYVIIALGLLFGLQWMGVGIGVLTIFAGIVGIGVGFGLQNIASNFISGLILTFGQSIKVGDLIEIGELMGEVKEITARCTTIETTDYRIILIPNSEFLTTKVINWSMGRPYIMAKLSVGVSYGTDVSLVSKLLLELANAHPKVLDNPAPLVRFNDFGSNSLDFALWIGVSNPLERFRILSELRQSVDQVFSQHHITIAFPQSDVHIDPDLKQAVIEAAKSYTIINQKKEQHPT